MRKAAIGDTVQVHYTGKFEDGSEFDSSSGKDPIEFTLGEGQVIRGFENAIVGMAEGETRSVTLSPDEAYGQHAPELVHAIDRGRIPSEVDLQVGAELAATDDDGRQTRLVVVDLSADQVTLDANHPLAGVPLNFDLRLDSFVG